ncbi:hypothetical protein VPH35_003421 [Triticum aestivum]
MGNRKEMKLDTISSHSSKIGAATERESQRDCQRLTSSKQSTSIVTWEKPRGCVKITSSQSAISSAIQGYVMPGSGLLHAPRKARWERATPSAPPLRSSKFNVPPVLIVIHTGSGGRQH